MKFFYRTVNVILLVAMIATITMFLVWKLSPKSLNFIGQKSAQFYINIGNLHTTKALEGLSTGDSTYAENLLRNWDNIGTDDRYYAHKRNIMLSLSKHLIENGEYKKSVDFLTPLLRENDRDIMLFIEWVKSAVHIPKLEQTVENELTFMVKRFPDHRILNMMYIRDVLYKNDIKGGVEAMANLKGFPPKIAGWSVMWKLKANAKYEKRFWVGLAPDEKQWSLNILAPQGATIFRIDTPPNMRMDISDIQIISETKATKYSISEIIETNMTQVNGATISADNLKHPYFIIPVPSWLSNASKESVINAKIVFDISNIGLDTVSDN